MSFMSVFPPADTNVAVDVLSGGNVAMRVKLNEGHFVIHCATIDELETLIANMSYAASIAQEWEG